jgi:cyclic-di-GMP phosphodiesterase TipF (flagellum assembly factor)
LGEEQIMTGNQTAAQTVVVVAMGLVAGACAVALYLHAGLPGPVAATASVAAYLLLLTVHAVVWRGARADFGASKFLDRRSKAIRNLKDDGRATPTLGNIPNGPGMNPNGPAMSANGPAMAARGARPAAQAPLPPAPPAPYANQVAPQGAMPMPPRPMPPRQEAHAGGQLPGPPPLTLPMGQPPLPPTVANAPELPPFVKGRAPNPAQEPAHPEPPQARTNAANAAPPQQPRPAARPPQASSPRESDVEVIQDAIKRLLEEVNAAEQIEARAATQSAQQSGPPALAQRGASAQDASNSAIEQSIEALRMTAGSMRSAMGERGAAPPPVPAAQRNGATAQPPPLPPFVRGASAPRAPSAADARARLMADAISAGRIDVALEPILGLEDQQTRHYEVTVRLRDADGNPLEVSPGGPDLRGTGLLPLFDGVRITRTAAVARRLEERGKGGSVFSSFSGESVADEHFLGELAETLHQRATLASQLVLSFTQSDVRGFSTPEWDSLADMRSLGFRFALSAITDLDMDFEALAEQGFAFVKLDASVFLEGLPAPSGRIPSSDVCRHLAMHGLTLVVEHIDDEDKLARVFGFGVLLGQGQLFGGPRPVRADVVGRRAGPVAA